MTLQNYRLITNKIIVPILPLLTAILFVLFTALDGGYTIILHKDIPLFQKMLLNMAFYFPALSSITFFVISYRVIGKAPENAFSPIPIIGYALLLLNFYIGIGLLHIADLRFTVVVAQMGFCTALLVMGNCVNWYFYVPANALYAILEFVCSFTEQRMMKWETWNPALEANQGELYYIPITSLAFMVIITLINLMVEKDAKKNFEMVNRLRYAKYHDILTGAYNRSYLTKKLFENKFFFTIDIDHFKKLNDGFGHEMGDKCLKKFADIVNSNIRKDDKLIRYGGEEFIVLFAGTSTKEEMHRKANDLRKVVEEETSKIKDMSDPDFVAPFTISIGVGYMDPRYTLEENIKVSDKYLYEAKEKGRNRVISILNSEHPW